MLNRIKTLILFCLAATLLLTACGGGAAAPTQAPAATEAPTASGPVSLRIGWGSTPDSLNPAYAFLAVSYRIFDLVYDPLVTQGPDGSYRGDLAESWSKSEDGLTWTFKLKDNIKWHTGEALTAEDVAWSINEIKNDPEGWATLVNYTNGFADVTAPDAKTVVITTEYPVPNIEYRVSFLYALYRKDFEPLTTTEDLQNFSNEQAIGTGLFKLNKFDKDQGIVILDRNPDYFDGPAKVDQVIFQTFDNNDALVQALKVGDVDALYGVPTSALETVRGFENVTVYQNTDRSFDELIINSASPDRDPAPTGNPALRDPAVKEAIALSLNKQDMVDIVFGGAAKPGWSIVAPQLEGGFWNNPNIQDVPFDTAKANQVLEDAGYVKGADGVRAKDGVSLDFRLQFDADYPEYARLADLMVTSFQEAGMKVRPEPTNTDTLTSNTTGVGDFDLVIWGWGGDPDPDFILSIMLCDQFEVGGWSDSGYCNPEYDQLYLDQQQASSPEERQQIVYKMQELLFRDKPYIVLYNYDNIQAFRSDRFTGFINSPNAYIESQESLQQVEPVK
jgi:peptide/nickel transport system substrate-binding protein